MSDQDPKDQAQAPDQSRADILTRREGTQDPYELGGEFFSRLARLLQAYLGVDPQQLKQVPRLELAKLVVPVLLMADATTPPWRKVGKAVMFGDAEPASGGNLSGSLWIVRPGSNHVAIVDWLDVTVATTERLHVGYTSAASPTDTPASRKLYSVEDQPTSPQGTNLVDPRIPVNPRLLVNGVANVFTEGTDFDRIWVGGGIANQPTHIDCRDVAIWPGVGLVVQGLTVNVGIDVSIHARLFDLTQLGSQNFTA